MANIPSRNYDCKNEELPIICRFVAFSFKRDLADFQSYAPRFDEEYVNNFESLISQATEITEPKSETLQIKLVTEKLYKTLDGLKRPLSLLTGYVNTIGHDLGLNPAGFGIVALRKSSNAKDVEATLKNLRLVLGNIERYQTELNEAGLKESLIQALTEAQSEIGEIKQKQYEIESNRKALVQSNQALFNNLYDQLTDILASGKILYKEGDKAKLTEYTFNKLKSRVRRGTGSNSGEDENGQAPESTARE